MIRFFKVEHEYDGQPALRGVDLRVDAGEFVFLIGPTGAGKTTLLRLILAQQRCSSGHVVVFGRDVATLKRGELPLHRRSIGTVFQDFQLLRQRTAFDNVALPLRIYGLPHAEVRGRVHEALQLVGLEHKIGQTVERLSGGEQQRVAIARAMVARPPLILADEPTGNLDPITAAETMHLFLDVQARGSTVLIVTHNLELVRMLGQRTVALRAGGIVSDTPAAGMRPVAAASEPEV